MGSEMCIRDRCDIPRCFGTRSGPTARVLDRLSSRTVGPRMSSAISRLLLPRSQPLLRKIPLDEEVAVPTAIPNGTRCKFAGLRSRMQYDLCIPACNGRVPALHGRTAPVPMRSWPPGRQLGHPGPVRSKHMARSPPLSPVCLIIAIFHLVRPPLSPAPDVTSSQSHAMRSCWPPPLLTAPSILMWSRGRKSTK